MIKTPWVFSRQNTLSCSAQEVDSRPSPVPCPSLKLFQHLNLLPGLGALELDTALEVPHQCQVQGRDHFPNPAAFIIIDPSQDTIGLLFHLGKLLLPHVQLLSSNPQVLSHWETFHPFCPQPGAAGVVVTWGQELALGVIELHTIGPSIQAVQISQVMNGYNRAWLAH